MRPPSHTQNTDSVAKNTRSCLDINHHNQHYFLCVLLFPKVIDIYRKFLMGNLRVVSRSSYWQNIIFFQRKMFWNSLIRMTSIIPDEKKYGRGYIFVTKSLKIHLKLCNIHSYSSTKLYLHVFSLIRYECQSCQRVSTSHTTQRPPSRPARSSSPLKLAASIWPSLSHGSAPPPCEQQNFTLYRR